MRKIAANFVVPVCYPPIKNGLIYTDNDGKIIEIKTVEQEKNLSNIEFYNGVIVPGFVSTHCHLELSYLKNKIPQNCGHINFLSHIKNLIATETVDFDKIFLADRLMYENGIVAVADISNTNTTISIKQKSKIYYHTFIEIYDVFDEKKYLQTTTKAIELKKYFNNCSIVPHSTYLASNKIFDFIENNADKIFTIHYLESPFEKQMFENNDGQLYNYIFKINPQKINTQKHTLTNYIIDKTTSFEKIILVHSLFIEDQDIAKLQESNKEIYFSICPKSNYYLYRQLPPIKLLQKYNCNITIGTDSLATNDTLNILEELKMLNDIDFETKIKWATLNGAKALGIEKIFGSIEPNKKPGLNLITNFDFRNFQITNQSKIQKII